MSCFLPWPAFFLRAKLTGYYAEAGYNLLEGKNTTEELIAFVRYENYNTHAEVESIAINDAYNRTDITIGLGLAAGANQIIVAIIGFSFIILVLFLRNFLSGRGAFKASDHMYLNIHTSSKDLKGISEMLADHFSLVELKRMDETDEGMDLSFIVDATSLEQIEASKKQLAEMAPGSSISFVEQKNIAL